MIVIAVIGGVGLVLATIFTISHLIEVWDYEIWTSKTIFLLFAWSFFFALAVLGSTYASPKTKSAMYLARSQYENCISYGPWPSEVKDRTDYCLEKADNFYRTLTIEGRNKNLTVNKKEVTNK